MVIKIEFGVNVLIKDGIIRFNNENQALILIEDIMFSEQSDIFISNENSEIVIKQDNNMKAKLSFDYNVLLRLMSASSVWIMALSSGSFQTYYNVINNVEVSQNE